MVTDGSRETRPNVLVARMKRSAYLINTSWGAVIDEHGLAWALRERLIAGVTLDAHEHEPQVHPDCRALNNIVLVPHLGSGTRETRKAMADLAVANLVSTLSGVSRP